MSKGSSLPTSSSVFVIFFLLDARHSAANLKVVSIRISGKAKIVGKTSVNALDAFFPRQRISHPALPPKVMPKEKGVT